MDKYIVEHWSVEEDLVTKKNAVFLAVQTRVNLNDTQKSKKPDTKVHAPYGSIYHGVREVSFMVTWSKVLTGKRPKETRKSSEISETVYILI